MGEVMLGASLMEYIPLCTWPVAKPFVVQNLTSLSQPHGQAVSPFELPETGLPLLTLDSGPLCLDAQQH